MVDQPEFLLPRDSYTFVEQVFDRSESLIQAQIWAGLSSDRLRRWRKNFVDAQDQYFAACVLDSLLYRSNEQTLALMQHLWTRKLTGIQWSRQHSAGDSWLTYLRGARDMGIRVVPAVDDGQVAKSGHVVARMLEKKLHVRSRYVRAAQFIRADAPRIVVFVDDLLGGGTQFEGLLRTHQLETLLESATVIYAPLVAHTRGIARLRTTFPTLQIVAAEILDETHVLLGPESVAFSDGANTMANVRRFYYGMLDRFDLVRMPPINGVEHLGIALAFEHAAPNNSMEILWRRGHSRWQPLFDR
jgi:uracil phosphoribosyltransferase